ncbi:hypothetical protein ACUALS_00920 [Vibrio sp. NH-7]
MFQNKKGLLQKITNVLIRLFSVGIRFFLTLYIAKYFPEEALGTYGFIIASVVFLIYPLGLEFYTYSNRELIKIEYSRWGDKISSQLLMHLILYAVFIPLYYLYYKDTVVSPVISMFLVLIVLEHINQEAFRLHIIMGDQIKASINIFLRSSIWAIVFVAMSFFIERLMNLECLMLFWISGQFIAIGYSYVTILLRNKISLSWMFDTSWIMSSFRVIIPLFGGTILLKSLNTIDKIIIEDLFSITILSAYVLYASLAGLVLLVCETAIFSFKYPLLLKFWGKDDAKYNDCIRSVFIQTTLCCVFSSSILWLGLPFILEWVGRENITNLSSIFSLLVFSKVVHCFGLIPHYALYSGAFDNYIMRSTFLGFLVFILIVYLDPSNMGFLLVPSALLVSISVIGASKLYCAIRLGVIKI